MKTVFVDVDTQIDFVFPAGALYVPGAETILPNIARLNQYASDKGHRLISTVDALWRWNQALHPVDSAVQLGVVASTATGKPPMTPSTEVPGSSRRPSGPSRGRSRPATGPRYRRRSRR